MKIRTHLLPVFGIAIVAGGALLHISQMVQNKEEQLHRLEQNIAAEEEAIRVLNAEWAYLNSPARLEELSAQYLGLVAPKTDQVLDAPDLLPVKPHVIIRPDTVFQEISLYPQAEKLEAEVSQDSDVILQRPQSLGRQDEVMTQGFSDVLIQSETNDEQGFGLDLQQLEPAGGAP